MSNMLATTGRRKRKREKVSISTEKASNEKVKNFARLVSPLSSPELKSKKDDSYENDVEILNTGGTSILNPNIEYAHARSDCGLHPFHAFVQANNSENGSTRFAAAAENVNTNPNSKHCPKCFCFVCDQPAENCRQWDSGEFHCNAHKDDPAWVLRRDQNKIPSPKKASSRQLESPHAKEKVAELKKILRQNGQHVTGRKAVLLERIHDGETYGRLGSCPECLLGRLKVYEGVPDTVICPGYFDGEHAVHCGHCCSAEEAPRRGPWIEPSNSKSQGKNPKKALALFEKYKVYQMKEMLQKNGQHVTGKKKELFERIVDGYTNGPLSHCPACHKGRLKVHPSETTLVICPGHFDFAMGTVESCGFRCSVNEAPREGSWEM